MRTTPAINKPPVRRRLFSEPDTCADDNWFNSTISKIYDDDAERLRTQWNFDPETDLPLDGPITWVRGHGAFDWIGTVKEDEGKEDKDNFPKDSLTTPRRERSVSAPPVRKRRIDGINVDMSKMPDVELVFPSAIHNYPLLSKIIYQLRCLSSHFRVLKLKASGGSHQMKWVLYFFLLFIFFIYLFLAILTDHD